MIQWRHRDEKVVLWLKMRNGGAVSRKREGKMITKRIGINMSATARYGLIRRQREYCALYSII